MRGIDVYQGEGKYGKYPLKAISQKAFDESDFVIVKATQGVSYGHEDFFTKTMDAAIKEKKLVGCYHYAGGHDPEEEAKFFLKRVKKYIGKAILCLDWESMQNSAWGSKSWCKKFLSYVKKTTGITCLLYTGLDGIHQNSDIANDYPLWFAGYPNPKYSGWTVPKFHYKISPWKDWTIWQFTSSGEKVDRNTCKLTKAEWISLASGKKVEKKEDPKKERKGYTGKFPSLPPRGYFKFGDGYLQYRGFNTQVKRVQNLVNWIAGTNLDPDGDYGQKTEDAVRDAQGILGIKQDGLFGKDTLAKARLYKK